MAFLLVAVGTYLFFLQHHAANGGWAATQNVTETELLQDNLVHLPGASLEADGLHIQPVPFQIVNQDGSAGQPNPPVNLYGGHLHTNGDITLRASLKGLHDGDSLSLYAAVPIIYDEFRYERNGLQLEFHGSQLEVKTWLRGSQQPASQKFALPDANGDKELVINRSWGRLWFSVNGHSVGSIRENRLFYTGDFWFGATAASQEWRLASLRAERGHNAYLQVVDTTALSVPAGNDTLNTLANTKKPGFTIGAAVALAPLVSDNQYANIALGGNFGSFTTENALKWQFVHPAESTYDFKESDAIVALAQEHKIQVHGHTLVFGEANPAWVQALPTATDSDKQHVQEVMKQHIAAVAGHFKGKMASWDVVNEPLADYDEFENGHPMRDHTWYRAMGEDYIAQAFQAARAADPGAKLYINEFGLEEDGERWDYFLQLVTRLKQAGVPIDGVGFQSHVYASEDKVNPDTLKQHMQQLADIGLSSHISEMDVYNDDGTDVQAEQYTTVLKACLEAASCDSFTTWGISDRYDMFRENNGSAPEYGQDFLWDTRMRPTPAVTALRNILR